MSFESELKVVDEACAVLAAALAATVRQQRGIAKAAAEGDLQKLRRLTEQLPAVLEAAQQAAATVQGAWTRSAADEEQYLADPAGYERELTGLARAAGVRLDRLDERLSAFPVLVSLLPAQRAVRLDAQRLTAVRPSVVVERLRAAQAAKPRLAPERFIETLRTGYLQLVGKDGIGKAAKLADVHDVLTLHPEMRRSYGRAEFTRDLHLLDRSGVQVTKSGMRLSLPSATGEKSKANVLSIVGSDGQLYTYSGIRFEAGAP